MINLAYKGFDWDSGNISKIENRFSLAEVEQFFDQELMIIKDRGHSINEERFIAIGMGQKSKMMFSCFTIRNNKIRVISARYMRRKEAEYYEKNKSKFE
jgi:uncharacterized DUF497 family protein